VVARPCSVFAFELGTLVVRGVGVSLSLGSELSVPSLTAVDVADGVGVSRVVQYAVTLASPPAVLIRTENAGFSRALPWLVATPAW
jgi:hypothetical protein